MDETLRPEALQGLQSRWPSCPGNIPKKNHSTAPTGTNHQTHYAGPTCPTPKPSPSSLPRAITKSADDRGANQWVPKSRSVAPGRSPPSISRPSVTRHNRPSGALPQFAAARGPRHRRRNPPNATATAPFCAGDPRLAYPGPTPQKPNPLPPKKTIPIQIAREAPQKKDQTIHPNFPPEKQVLPSRAPLRTSATPTPKKHPSLRHAAGDDGEQGRGGGGRRRAGIMRGGPT